MCAIERGLQQCLLSFFFLETKSFNLLIKSISEAIIRYNLIYFILPVFIDSQ